MNDPSPHVEIRPIVRLERFLSAVQLGSVVLLVGIVIWVFLPVLKGLFHQLTQNEDNTYGLILPVVAGFIAYRKWPIIKSNLWSMSWLGVAIIAVGLAGYLISELLADLLTARISFVVVISGVICLLGGKKLLHELLFPLLLICLMFPLPLLVARQLSLPLQMISSKMAWGFLHILGYPVLLSGNIIDLGDRQLQVVGACSGLRYLINLGNLTIIFCYFFQRRPWKIAVLLASIIPYALVANAVRLACIGIFPILEKGWWHTSIGLTIFLCGFDYLKAVNWLLNKIEPIPEVSTSPPKLSRSGRRRILKPATLLYPVAAILLVVLGGFSIKSLATIDAVPLRQKFENFPLTLGAWQGKHAFIDPRIMKALQADDTLNVHYVNGDKPYINLWIAYYANVAMAGGIHSPMLCMTSSGWHLKESGVVQVLPGSQVKYMVMEEPHEDVLVNYWYIQQNRWLSNHYAYKLNMIFDKLWHHRSDASLVRLITPLQSNKSEAQARLTAFTRLLAPILPKFIPE